MVSTMSLDKRRFPEALPIDTVVAVDPGRNQGVAVFHRPPPARHMGFSLVAAELVEGQSREVNDLINELREKTRLYLQGVFQTNPGVGYPVAAITEYMEWRPDDARSVAEDLIQVSTGAAVVVSAISGNLWFIPPPDWKGTVPKDICNTRVLSLLSPGERKRIPSLPEKKLHNVIDAVGIGMFFTRRMERGAVRCLK